MLKIRNLFKKKSKTFNTETVVKKPKMFTEKIYHVLNITGSLNNTFFNLTNLQGESIYNTSCGAWNFTGSKKASTFAIKDVGRNFVKWMRGKKVKSMHLVINGLRRRTLKRVIKMLMRKFDIGTISYPEVKAHNGCRKKKLRRH